MGSDREDIRIDREDLEASLREMFKAARSSMGEVISDEMKIEYLGAWFVYSWDMNAYPIALFGSEVEALRVVECQGYGNVIFWPFGKTWDEVKP